MPSSIREGGQWGQYPGLEDAMGATGGAAVQELLSRSKSAHSGLAEKQEAWEASLNRFFFKYLFASTLLLLETFIVKGRHGGLLDRVYHSVRLFFDANEVQLRPTFLFVSPELLLFQRCDQGHNQTHDR